MVFKCEEILKAVNGKLICGDADLLITNISIDSRKVSQGDLYIPIVGERFDGHDYINEALNAGASISLTHKDIARMEGKTIIRVEDTTKALGDLAKFYRSGFNIPFVGITGSVGKTSAKDMISSALSQKYTILKTSGNLNNEIGLSLTMFNLDRAHESAVIEMGMSGLGEISILTSITRPDIAVITNVGMSHIESLGSRQNILKAKMEILEGLSKDGLVVLNMDDPLLSGMKDLLKHRTVFVGTEEGADYQAFNIKTSGENGTRFEITIDNEDYRVFIPVPGVHNVYHALAALAVGIELKVPILDIIKGIKGFSLSKMRMDVINHNGIKIINDVYNASPQSMEAALSVLKDMESTNRRIAVLGDMLELGEWSKKAHFDIGILAASLGIDVVLTVGDSSDEIRSGAIEGGIPISNTAHFANNNEVKSYLEGFVKEGDVFLVKGSRGMGMEEIVDYLKKF